MGDEDRAIDEIYAAPHNKFVAARDAWVKRLRDEGHKEAAARLKTLKRPSVAAWILNQIARAHGKDLEALIDAGKTLAAAQRSGDREALRKSSDEVRGRVRVLLQRAREVLGKAPAPSLGRALGQALHHAAAGELVDELRAGRLEREPSGATGFESVEGPIRVTPPPKPKKKEARTDDDDRSAEEERKRERERQRERERLSHDLERAQKRAERLRREADQAAREADEAERAVAALEKKLETT